MSLSTTTYVLNRRFGNQIRKLIMIAIADYTGDDTGTAWAFIDTLAARAECSRRSIQEHLEILEREGELEIYRNAGPKGSHRFKILKRFDHPEQPLKRGANPAPHPELWGADPARGVQMSAAQTAERGADERRPFAPKTIEQEENNRERETGASAPRSPASVSPDELCDLIDAINSCRPEWQSAPVLNAKEYRALRTNLASLNAILPKTWQTVGRYLKTRLPEGTPGYQPTSREKLIEAAADVITYAVQWERKQRPPTPKKPQPEESTEPALTIEESLAILQAKP